jgi:hypothetical protein
MVNRPRGQKEIAAVRLRIALGAALASAVVAGVFASAGGSTVSAECSRAAALRVGKPYFWDAKYTVAQLLCGQFTGPGSDAMVVAFAAPTCWPLQGWAVFAFSGGDWRRVLLRRGVFVYPLKAVGGDIRETEPVRRAGDARCTPSGGRRSRTWQWDGSRLVAASWKQTQRPAAPPRPSAPTKGIPGVGYFKSPSGNIVCAHAKGSAGVVVECGIHSGLKPKPPYNASCRASGLDHNADRISLAATGRTPYPRACSGDAGPFVGQSIARVLAYGKTWSRAGISCRSAFTGMTCRNRSGHGFFLSRARWRRF